jgi:hypothetical protein
MDVDQVFDANPTSVQNLFGVPGQCFYIPAYQRPYSWSREHIGRLFEDLSHGVDELRGSTDAISFLGTVITIHDTTYATVEPKVQGQLPARVMTVVDGQQRLTTLLILFVLLHNEITVRHAKTFGKNKEGEWENEEDKWLAQQSVKTSRDLARMLEDERGIGDCPWYPRMTRAYDDRWSQDSSLAKYESPIAELLDAYGKHQREWPGKKYKHHGDGAITTRLHLLRNSLNSGVAGSGDKGEGPFPSTAELIETDSLGHQLFQGGVPDRVEKRLTQDEVDFTELFRILVFARFALERVAVTLVVVKSEEYAFDMFEALNTTGEPLTAFETFKPKVIRAEGHSKYEHSDSYESMETIEGYLGKFTTAQQSQRETAALLIAFAAAEEGEKLPRALRQQRKWLMSSYDKLADLDEQRAFVRHLSKTAQVIDRAWKPESGVPDLYPLGTLSTEARLCIDVLRDANHNVILAPLTRFYALACSGDLDIDEVQGALKAMTGFFGLWRGAFGSTNRIDGVYRTLMASGQADANVAAFARNPKDGGSDVPSSDALQRYMVHTLQQAGIGTKRAWVNRASEIPVYDHNRPLARLLLLAATHDTIPDKSAPGLVKKGNKGVLPLLTYETWTNDQMVSLEHVAPQTATEKWDSELYEPAETIHRLGNLLLVPTDVNASLSNEPWEVKRACYRVISAASPDEAEAARKEAKDAGVKLTKMIASGEDQDEYRPLAAGIAACEGTWDPEMVKRRSQRLAEIAWDRLAPWVGLASS